MKTYMSNTMVVFNQIKDCLHAQVLPIGESRVGTLYFIDLQPEANWSHPCIYLFSEQNGENDYVCYRDFPPTEKVMSNMREVENR